MDLQHSKHLYIQEWSMTGSLSGYNYFYRKQFKILNSESIDIFPWYGSTPSELVGLEINTSSRN